MLRGSAPSTKRAPASNPGTPLSNLAASAPVPDPESEVPSTESSLLCDSMYARLRSHLANKAQPSNPGWWDDSGLADLMSAVISLQGG